MPTPHVKYIQYIPFPPRRIDVVKETIVESKKVYEECGSTLQLSMI